MSVVATRAGPPLGPAMSHSQPIKRAQSSRGTERTTTLEIHNNFKQYGNVRKIVIFDRRQDDRGTRASLYFEPPPEHAIWEHGRIAFTTQQGVKKYVELELSKRQPKNFQIESSFHRGVKYNEKTELFATSLAWGVLAAPEIMMTMASTEAMDECIKLVLNLYHRELVVQFPYVFRSQSRVATRRFRFKIALDETFKIWKLPDNRYILHLSSIPWYSKQLKEAIALTHHSDAGQWSEEDTWARQTDIFEHKNNFEVINKTPLSLQKNLNSINIARWTTFQVTLLDTEANKAADSIFCNALKDFNVNIYDMSTFKVVAGDPNLEVQVWATLSGHHKSDRLLSLAEELSRSPVSFIVRYQLEVCLSHGWLSEYQLTSEFLKALSSLQETQALQMLVYIDSYQQRVWEPMQIFNDLRYRRPVRRRPLPEHCIEVRSATVTATSIIWNTPTVEITNRVIRKHKAYADRFLRVRFEDDVYRGQSRLYASNNNKMILVFQRVKRVLLHGILLGDRHYEFLAWGNSQLREHGAYFFAKGADITASKIRAEMGAFDQEKVVAKRAARMGQCFSTTRPVHLKLPIFTSENTIPDIRQGRYVFTDGVGKISTLAAELVVNQLKIKGPTPSVFQFRLGGCKGVLTVWPGLVGAALQVRKSQFKFDSLSVDLEIIRWSEFWQPFLNRQVITCLSELGVADHIFIKKQNETINALNMAMKNDKVAIKALRNSIDPNLMTLSMVDLVEAGFRAAKEPFVTSILHLWKAWSLKHLKEKAKIPVPNGAFVLGCVDETNTLRGHYDQVGPPPDDMGVNSTEGLPEIFIQITDAHTNQRKVIEGVCVLARNPSLHRGDIRVVKAIDVPALRHLCDAVVMPANGDRDLPSMCSGGDLDGDDYMVIWDQELIPEVWNVEPFHYDPPPPKTATGEITTRDMINFFYDYMQNDSLGRIAHAHLAAADYLDDGLQSRTCLELVNLHSMAVDYPKTGVPAIMQRRLERNNWPHFMEKKRGSTYQSHKVLGKLYDAVKRIPFTPTYDSPFDKRILNTFQPTEQVLEAIKILKRDYDDALQRIMVQHNIKTEFEVWSTFVLDHSKASRDYKFHEEIGQLSSTLKEQYYEALCELAGGKDFEKLAPIAIAAYQFTNAIVQTARKEVEDGLRSDGPDGMPFISFPWILKDTLCRVARDADISIVEPGSVTIVQNGKLIDIDQDTYFDEKDHTQIRLQDPFDLVFGHNISASTSLPDPYQPHSEGRQQNEHVTTVEELREDTGSRGLTEANPKTKNVMTDTTLVFSLNLRPDKEILPAICGSTQSVDSPLLCEEREVSDEEKTLAVAEAKEQEVEDDVPSELQAERGEDVKAAHTTRRDERPGQNVTQSQVEDFDAFVSIDDPLHMTTEQFEQMGFTADMEL